MATGTMIHHSCPKVGEIFELGIDGDATNNHPLTMVRSTGNDPRVWVHNGRLVVGRTTGPFKLVEIASHGDFDEVLRELACRGRIPEGQWVGGFKIAFPKPNGKKHIAIADATWVGPDGRTYFPYISRAGDLRFHRSNGSFGGDCWLWIVRVVGRVAAMSV